MLLHPGQDLQLTDEELSSLSRYCCEIIDALEAQHARLFHNLGVWWDLYEAVPMQTERTTPWRGASNIVVPFIREKSDAVSARYNNVIFGNDKVYIATTKDEALRDIVPHVADFLNWGVRWDYQLDEPGEKWTEELTVVGTSVLGLRWEDRRTWIIPPTARTKSEQRKPEQIRLHQGPMIEHIPREFILWDQMYPIAEAPVVVRQSLMTYSDMVLHAQSTGWDEEAVKASKGSAAHGDTGGMAVALRKQRQALVEPSLALDAYELHDIRELWAKWPVLRAGGVTRPGDEEVDQPSVDVLLTLHRGSGKILRAIAKPYLIRGAPFYEAHLRKRIGHDSSEGYASILEHIQRGLTTMTNQAVDVVTRANSMGGKTTDPRVLSQDVNPAMWLLLDDIGAAVPFEMPKPILPDIALINMLIAMGERLSGISDPALGRETRLGGHPSPATSTLAFLQESNKMFLRGVRSIRRELGKLGLDILTLYQQFEPTDERGVSPKIVDALGEQDGLVLSQYLFSGKPIQTRVELDLRTLTESLNPDSERNRAVLVDQVVANYYARVLQMLQLRASPEVPQEMKDAATQAIKALSSTLSDMLKNSDVDSVEDFLYRVQETNDVQQQFLDTAAGRRPPGGGEESVPQQRVGATQGSPRGEAPIPLQRAGTGF